MFFYKLEGVLFIVSLLLVVNEVSLLILSHSWFRRCVVLSRGPPAYGANPKFLEQLQLPHPYASNYISVNLRPSHIV